MYIESFEIKNFKGIKSVKIDVPNPGKNSIVSLIGLNESGKTTILEAISKFVSGDDSISVLYDPALKENAAGVKNNQEDAYQFVPKGRKANFTDNIEISAKLKLNDSDIDKLASELKTVTINRETFPKSITIERAFNFKNSTYEGFKNLWTIRFDAKVGTQRKFRTVSHFSNKEAWLEVVNAIIPRLPRICYFPTFLFDFPKRIYLVEHSNENEQNKLYRQVIQDVLDSEGSGLKIDEHIVKRLRPETEVDTPWSALWLKFTKRDEKQQVEAVLNQMGAHISKTVFGSWDQIFGRKLKNKRIEVKIDIDDENDHLPYLEFVIFDGPTKYYLHERSLGFRWFFSFLLFTEFRAARKNQTSTIFLFDEPASNLHAKAQLQLLSGFNKITGDNASIIYSTHSLYLIEPRYLETAYIIDNKALDFESEDVELEFENRETDVIATKYKSFVGQYPDRGSYYQPVFDKLNSVNSPIMLPDDVVIMEGKTDFYFVNYFQNKYGIDGLSVFPGAGASTSDVLISLALGFGRNFLVLADDDVAGRKSIKKYKSEYYIADHAITYADLDETYKNYKLESFFSTKTQEDIKAHFGVSRVKKKHVAMFFQEHGNTLTYELDDETKDAVSKMLNLVLLKLKNT